MSSPPLRILFAGTPAFAALHLKALIDSKHQLIGVYTQPDRPAGRGKKLQPSAVKVVAEAAQIPVYQPPSLKEPEAQSVFAAHKADLLIVVAYGLILPLPILTAPGHGCLNVHASILPRWRGAAPIQRAIEAGDPHSGITIMQMDEGLDTGDILATQSCPITPEMSAADLHDALATIGTPLLLNVLDNLDSYQANRQPQPDAGATYAHKILKPEAAIDWSLPAAQVDARIRAFNPFPVCYSLLRGERVRLWQARPLQANTGNASPGTLLQADDDGIAVACGEGSLLITTLQLPGGKQLPAKEILRAKQALFTPGMQFDSPAVSAH